MIVYGTHTNLNIWNPIVCGNNQSFHTKGEPGCQSLLFNNFCPTSENYRYFRQSFPVDLSTGRLLKVGFDRSVRIDHVIIHRGSWI